MKIIGFTYVDEGTQIVLKGDSCLLVNRKPFFRPDWSQDLRMNRCIVLRVSRLGKSIAPRFADRYYDAIANGADFTAYDKLEQARLQGKSWTEATCFDYSLAVGEWEGVESRKSKVESGLVIGIDEAIAEASRIMTIRQGDLIYIHEQSPAQKVERDEIIEAEGLYCKVK